MSEEDKPPEQFEDYILYRFRLEEAVLLQGVLEHLEECSGLPARPADAIRAVHLAIATHVAGFFDNRDDSLNVFRLWKKYFSHRAAEIDAWEVELRPLLDKLRRLRNRAGAHADRRIAKQNEARTGLPGPEMGQIMKSLWTFGEVIAKDEGGVPGLSAAIVEWGLRPGHLEEEARPEPPPEPPPG